MTKVQQALRSQIPSLPAPKASRAPAGMQLFGAQLSRTDGLGRATAPQRGGLCKLSSERVHVEQLRADIASWLSWCNVATSRVLKPRVLLSAWSLSPRDWTDEANTSKPSASVQLVKSVAHDDDARRNSAGAHPNIDMAVGSRKGNHRRANQSCPCFDESALPSSVASMLHKLDTVPVQA